MGRGPTSGDRPATSRRSRPAAARLRLVAAVLALAVVAVACASDDGDASAPPSTDPATTEAPAGDQGADAPLYYVSLGDSYAQGYQPGVDAEEGFAYHVPELARARGWDLELVNFGCGGATTRSLIEEPGCVEPARAPGGPDYEGTSQLDAAIAFVEDHPGRVAVVTVSISGNDVTRCVAEDDPVTCVATAMGAVRDDLAPALRRLRAATGPDTRILGLTYPNVILGSWVRGQEDLAELSVVAFRELINPTLAEAYASADADFVDVTEGTGAYRPLTETTTLEPYGEIPVAVAQVCELTWFCEEGDIHATSEGYRAMAELIVEALPPPG